MYRFSVIALAVFAIASSAIAATPVATYRFDGDFAADQLGAPALVAVDPLSASAFASDTVFGDTRQVWQFDGNDSPSNQQAGLTLNTTGLVSPTSYSVEMVFLFSEKDNNWRRILDNQNRQSDFGFYVNPVNVLNVIPISGVTAWTNNTYHHVTLVNDGSGSQAYLDGIAQFSGSVNPMNLNNVNNPGLLMNFFLDNLVGGSQTEYSDGRVALIRLWDGTLTSGEVLALAANPFVPEPAGLALIGVASFALALIRSRRNVAVVG